jgi:DNA polymerase epsilon subunit 1
MVTTRRKALLELGDVIKKMKADETKPVIAVVQSPNQALLSHDIPILKDLPILPLHPDESDKQLPPLGWQSFIAKRLVGHKLDLGSWVSHII